VKYASSDGLKSFSYSVLFLLISTFAFGQTGSLLERSVTLSAYNEPVDLFLKKLSNQAGCIFAYSSSIIDRNKKVSATFTQQSVREILETVFNGQVACKQKGDYIILTKAPALQNEVTIKGYLVDEASGERIARASVYDPITLRSVVSDDYGFFQIKVKSPAIEPVKLEVKKENYSDTLLVTPSGRSTFQKFSLRANKEKWSLLTQGISNQADKFWRWTKQSVSRTNLTNVRDPIHRTWQVSFVPFVGTNRKLSGNVTNDYSFNMLGGYSGGTRKAEFGGLFNINRGEVQHVQMAGLFNANGGFTNGVQLAGLFNAVFDSVSAVQAGGLFNLATKSFSGVQLGGLMNVVTNDVSGVQVAGLFNVADHITGTQVSGLVNVARSVSGLQIGFINITDSIKGVPVGFLSFVNKGYHTLEVAADEMFPANIAFRTGVRPFYTIITAGIRPENADTLTWSFGYGVGTSPRLSKKLFLNFDITSNQIVRGRVEALNLVNKFFVGFDYSLTRKVAVFGGATLNWRVYDSAFTKHPELFTWSKPAIVYETTSLNRDIGQQLWWGAKIGVRFF
jgi:hypothetical protein